MDDQQITRILEGDSKELKDLRENKELLNRFMLICKRIDSLPDMKIRFYEDSRSLYQVTSQERDIQELETIFSDFFGPPSKAAGKKLPLKLKFNPSVKYLGGIRKDQSLFLKKTKTGEFYGALWPWQRDPGKIEVHLGYCSSRLSDEDYNKLGRLVQKELSKSAFMQMGADVGGLIHGISLPSFLQMSEMEESTFTLKVSRGNDIGLLFLSNGELIAAETDILGGSQAAYKIISWENVSIEIHAEDPDRPREIREPLMHTLMESLKIKDEARAAEPEKPSPPAETPPPEPVKTKKAPSEKKKAAKKKKPPAAPEKKKAAKKKAPPAASKPHEPEAGFQKAVGRSMPKQKESILPKLLLAIVLVALIGGAIVVGKNVLDKKKVDLKYRMMLTAHDAEPLPEKRKSLLSRYLSENPRTPFGTEVNGLLADANKVIEKKDFDRTTLEVNSLVLDDSYEKKALAIYTGFLEKYPESPYAAQINKSISGIRDLLGKNSYEQLESATGLDFKDRMNAYDDYLKKFPDGRQRRDVEKLITDLSKEYYLYLQKRVDFCDKEKKWDLCIGECNDFLSFFADSALAEKVGALKAFLLGKKLFETLEAKETEAGTDFEKIRKMYTASLDQTTSMEIVSIIKDKLEKIDNKIALKDEWENTRSHAVSGLYSVRDRLARLNAYIKAHPQGNYIDKAKAVRTDLEAQLAAIERAEREKERKRKAYEQRQAQLARMQKERQRIEQLKKKARQRLLLAGGRYTANRDGTFTDSITGLTWCLLDSSARLSGCIDYQSALAYVKNLETGGHRDWRLPSAGELAVLYKNRPFYPDDRIRWYWSSEAYARGFHTVVDIVSSKKETIFIRQHKSTDDCGSVRAVRK